MENYKKVFTSPDDYEIHLYLGDSFVKRVLSGENSKKVIAWLAAGNEFEEIPFVYDLEALKLQRIELVRLSASRELTKTDYKVVRHYGQKLAGITPSLTDAEFIALEESRQAIRDWCNDTEELIDSKRAYHTLMDIPTQYEV